MKPVKHFILIVLLLISNLGESQETVSLRTDRDIYIAGESVWFSASCLKNGASVPSGLSTVLYVELLNQRNVPVTQLKLFLNNGTFASQFVLPDTLATGNYLLRAYTKWMRNYNTELYFSKQVAVINPFSKNPFPKSDHIFSSDTVFFYPEGGKTLKNHPTQILAQSFDKFGKLVAFSGELISPSGATIQKLESNNEGIQSFEIQPGETGMYRFHFLNTETNATIPAFFVTDSGYNFHLKNESNSDFTFTLQVGNRNESKNGKIDIVTTRGVFIQSYPVPISDNTSVSIDPNDLPTGYLCAFLFDTEENELASRYFMANKAEQNNSFKITTDKNRYPERTKVSVHLENPKSLNRVSVSVVKDCLLNYKKPLGKLFRPDFLPFHLFSESIPVNDLLLPFVPVTKIWKEPDQISYLPEMKGEIISGNIVNLENQQPLKNQVFMLNFVDKVPTIDFSVTDSEGRFFFEANRYGEQEMVIQPFNRDTLKLNYKVNLDIPFCTEYSDIPVQPLFVETEKISEFNRAIVNMQISAFYKSSSLFPAQLKAHPTPVSFYGNPEISVVLDNYIELPTMEEVFREIIPNAHLVKNDGKFAIVISEADFPDTREVNSFCMVDGVPVFNQNNILNIQPAKTEKIDVLKTDFYVQNFKLGKILNLTTTKGDMSAFDFDKRIFRQSYKMYALEYLFNDPDYSSDSIKNSRIPDFRNVLYWNPNISFDKDYSADFSFYTSDETARFVIVVEGINKDGIIEQQQYSFEVSRDL